jgi:transposase-like protein
LEEPQATETERTIATADPRAGLGQVVEPTQTIKAARRRFTKEDKLRILRLADAAKEHGKVGEVLRREGIYYSTLKDFQKQRANGKLEPGYERNKQTVIDERTADKKRIAELETQNHRLQHRLSQAEMVIDVQKKLSQLLGVMLPQTDQIGQQSEETLY